MNLKKPANVEVKRASAGLGLFTVIGFKKGEEVVQYTGEKITNEEADRRGGRYLFNLDETWTIDGKSRNNTARYINHSCDPNCEAVHYTDVDEVMIETVRDIGPGEELTIDYGEEYVAQYITPYGCRCDVCTKK